MLKLSVSSLLFLAASSFTCGFTIPRHADNTFAFGNKRIGTMLLMSDSTVSTLTEETTWRLRFALNGVPTMKGRKVGELFVVDVQFAEEEGYEPPQGYVKQILPQNDEEGNQRRFLEVSSGRWQLSEDPDERKDGLWVWGLFKEPQYPFMLLQIETKEFSLPAWEDGDSITPLKLYAQITHKRDKKTGEVQLEASALNVREVETVKADLFGAATADVYEEVKVGQLSLRPLDIKATV